MLFPPKPVNAFPNSPAAEEQTAREHRYVCLDVYIQPLNTQRTMELGWVPVTRTTKPPRSAETRSPDSGILLTDSRPEVSYSLDSRHAMSVLQNLCVTQGLQLSHLRVAISPPDGTSNPKELPLDPLLNVGNTAIPCRLSPSDGSVRCQMRVFSTIAQPEQTLAPTAAAVPAPIVTGKQIPKLDEVASPETPEYGFHSDAGVMEILHPSQPTLAEQQSATRERVKGITDRGRLCKELRHAVPSHLKKRKNRRAVIKTLKDLEEYMGSIDPVFEECGNTPELCATAARTIGLSNTRFIELRRMWEAYLEELKAENHEIMELSPNKEACTLRKLVAILERYGWSCTSAQPRSSEDISKPPRPPTIVESPNWLGALRKRPSLNTLTAHQFDSDYESDFSPKRPRSEYASSEEGNTSDEGEVFSAPEPLITSIFEQKYPLHSTPAAEEPSLLDDTFFLPTWTPRDSSSSDIPNITFDAPDVDLFNELERQILSEFL